MEIKGRKVLVTGAASGIGRATAIRMARDGGVMLLTDINGPGLDETCRIVAGKGGEVAMSRVMDIGEYEEVKTFAREVHERFGPLDILVNVAGVALFSQVEDMRHEDGEKVIRVNLWGPVHGVECFVPDMVRARKPGHIVNVSSAAGIIGLPWHSVYAGTKHALVGMSESLKYDLKKHRIGVSVVCPGAVRTGLVDTVDIRTQVSTARLKDLFFRYAVPPEQVADIITDAVRKGRFLVITAMDIRILYFLKHHVPILYRFLMNILTGIMDKMLKPGTA